MSAEDGEAGAPAAVLAAFALDGGRLDPVEPGNVHDTHFVTVDDGRFVLQRINTEVFVDPHALMENALLTAECMRTVAARPLEYRATVSGSLLAEVDGGAWRSYRYVEGRVVGRPSTVDEAARIGEAFGRFDAAMAIHPPERWHTVVADYHDQSSRVAALDEAIAADAVGRLGDSQGTVRRLREVLGWIDDHPGSRAWAELPTRVAHHDAKGVNLVFADDGSMAVLDLDTVMAGTILSDVGELVRTCARPGEPGAPFDVDIAVAAVHAFIDGWGLGFGPAEVAALPVAGVRMTAQNAVRFLTDHLQGDTYYRTVEPGENLRRAEVMIAHAEAQIAVHAAYTDAVLR